MKKLQHLLWLTVFLLGSNALAVAQDHKQTVKDESEGALKVNTSIEVRGAYDLRNYYGAPGFGAATISMKDNTHNRKRSLLDISSATLSIEKALALSEGNMMKLVLKASLGKQTTLGTAYAEFERLRVGKAKTNFCDPDGCGLVGGNSVQVRWRHQWNTSMSYAIAIEEAPDFVIYPEAKKDEREGKDLQPHKNIPAVSANVRYEEEKQWHAQLGGLFRFLEYHNQKSGSDVYLPAWGISMSAALHLVPEKTTLKAQGVYGQGIGNYLGGLSDLKDEVNTVYTTGGEASEPETLNAWGVGISMEHKWYPELRSEVTYKFVDTLDRERGQGAYERGHTASANLFYHPNKQVKIGAEYLLGVRQDISKHRKGAHRIQAVVGFEL